MAKASGKSLCPQVGSFSGVTLMVLGFYVLFMCYESHRRSSSSSVDWSSTRSRILSSVASETRGQGPPKACKSVSVATHDKEGGTSVAFWLGGQSIEFPPDRGINVVTLDPWRQLVVASQGYDAAEANHRLLSDLGDVASGHVALVGIRARSLDAIDVSVLEALKKALGSSLTQGFREGYALIVVKGRGILAEGMGSSAQALGLLPCNSGVPVQPPGTAALRGGAAGSTPEDSAAGPKEESGDENVDKKQSADPLKGSPETTYRCVGGSANRSCLFRNLYYHQGRFAMFVLKKPKKSDIEVFRADKYEGEWEPDIEEFPSEEKIQKHLDSKVVIEERGLSVQFNPLFHHNIGHALFDGLYPAFVATVKLQVQDRPWRPVVAVDPGCFADGVGSAELSAGDLVEAYLPHERYGRTLRAVRARIIRAPKTAFKEAACDWREGFDHSGLDLGSQQVEKEEDQKAACAKACGLTFGCKAGVLFSDVCYLKGTGGSEFHRDDRPGIELCKLKGDGPKANIAVKPEPGFAGDMKEVTIPDAWIVSKVRPRCMSEGIYEQFGMTGQMRRLFELERDARNYPKLLLRFEELVVGVGGAGNMVADLSGAIGGSLEPFNAMTQFRDRMLRAYDLPVERGVKPLSAERKLNVMIVSNKRFTSDDREALDEVISKLEHKGGVHAEYVDWGRIGGPDNKFREHLKRTQQADVYVSSIGTALQYVPFMKDGKVYIALGAVWMRAKQYFPTFMEQQLAGGGTPYLRTLYADPGGVLRAQLPHEQLNEDGFFAGVNGTLVSELMHQAEAYVRKGFKIPVAPEENLSVEAKILIELCKRDPVSCKKMMDNRNGAVYECALLVWCEAVVYEVGPWRKGGKCGSAHHELLRQLRKEHGLPGYGAPSHKDEKDTSS